MRQNQSSIKLRKTVSNNLTKYIKILKRKCYENGPYSRRECLQISAIPDSIEDNILEETVLNVFSKFNAPVNSSNVEDCHCLKLTNNASQKVIVKLPERKGVYRVSKAKPSLKNADLTGTVLPPDIPIFVNRTLWKYAKFLCSKYKKTRLDKMVESSQVQKRSCRIRLVNKSAKIIGHISDLKILFSGNSILEENLGNS